MVLHVEFIFIEISLLPLCTQLNSKFKGQEKLTSRGCRESEYQKKKNGKIIL